MMVSVESIRGAGLCLRAEHMNDLLSSRGDLVPWLEILVDNYLDQGGVHLERLDRLSARFPIIFHSVGLNLGSIDPLDHAHLARLRLLCDRFHPPWIADHLAWTGARGRALHDLLPLPRTREVIRHVAARAREVQDVLEVPLLIENISSYVEVPGGGRSEWEFAGEVAEEADIGILFDVNNACVNARNAGAAPDAALSVLPRERVKQMHLAGAERRGDVWIDTHGGPVDDEVWLVFRAAIDRFGPLPTCIERDRNVPPLAELLAERELAAAMLAEKERPR
jgi:hypothetical protein